MDKDKLLKAMQYAQQNPSSEFATELKKRMQLGEFNSALKEEGIDTSRFAAPKKEGFFKKLGKGLIKSEVEFGKSLAGAVDIGMGRFGAQAGFEKAQSQEAQTITQLLRAIRDKEAKGEDASRFRKLLDDIKGVGTPRNELLERQASLSTRQVIGQAGGVAVDVLGAGTVGTKTAGLITKPTSFLRGVAKGAGVGAATGGGFGAAQGLARGLQEDRKGADLASEAISGGLVGGLAGGVLGGLTGGTSGVLRGKSLRKKQLIDALDTDPDLVAKYNLTDTGKIVKDTNVQEVLKQGLPEKHAAVIKNANLTTTEKFKRMFGFAERATKDARAIERPSDVVGESIVERTKHLLKNLRKSGQGVDDAANGLRGQKANPQEAVQQFMDDLSDDIGVTFKNGKPVFEGSAIEGITPAENLINKLSKRMQEVSDDAHELHKLKKFIDEQVTFGKMGEGLAGSTERIVKGFRSNIDNLLDSNFTNYDKANSSYRVARRLFDDTKTVVGRNFDPNAGTIRAGSVARRILGNSANRGDILEYLKALETFYKQTGGKADDDILSQVVFADVLEDIFGTQATTGLSGQVQRGIEQAGGVAQDVAQGQPLAGAVRGAIRIFQATRGISTEAQIEAIAKLIGVR